MVTSKDVFAKRREGALDEAYQMALELVELPGADDWDRKALAWCCVDLIKREATSGKPATDEYRAHLEKIDAAEDEILRKQIQFALSLCTTSGAEMAKARSLSKSGKHLESAAIYRKLIVAGSTDADTHNALSWELYRLAKSLMDLPGDAAPRVKPLLQEYLRLRTERPSLIHSCMLQAASALAGDGKLDMAVFSQMWGLQHFRHEDYERFKGQDGKDYPSLVEKVLQQAAKSAAKSQHHDWSTLLPYLKSAVTRYADNRWLKLRYARALLSVGRADDAFAFALQVVKALQTEYWAWELLGDIEAIRAPDRALNCYGKALGCAPEEKFIANLRIKFATLLAPSEPAHAKLEIEQVIRFCEQDRTKLPSKVEDLRSEPWFAATDVASSNSRIYTRCGKAAELLLASDLEWVDGNVGDTYPDPRKDGKLRRHLIIRAHPEAFEISVPANKYGLGAMESGDGIRAKGEFNSEGRFQIYLIEERAAAHRWDAVPELIAVVDHVNREKQVVHFVIRQGQDGLIRFGDLQGDVSEGDAIAIRRAKYMTKEGSRFRILSASKTSSEPSPGVRKPFQEPIRVESGMGFTNSDIFVPPPLVSHHGLRDGEVVEGIAVLTFNKKRGVWGLRAVSVRKAPAPP
jgi:hypothetical protein